jgi:hypothetical protein
MTCHTTHQFPLPSKLMKDVHTEGNFCQVYMEHGPSTYTLDQEWVGPSMHKTKNELAVMWQSKKLLHTLS